MDLTSDNFEVFSNAVVFWSAAEIDLIFSRVEWAIQTTVDRVDKVFNECPGTAKSVVGVLTLSSVDCRFCWNKIALTVSNFGRKATGVFER